MFASQKNGRQLNETKTKRKPQILRMFYLANYLSIINYYKILWVFMIKLERLLYSFLELS